MVLPGKGLQVLSVHWEEMTVKDWQIEKNRTLRSPPDYGVATSPLSLIWSWVQLSPDTRHVLGDAGQEGLNLLVQQGLWAPLST